MPEVTTFAGIVHDFDQLIRRFELMREDFEDSIAPERIAAVAAIDRFLMQFRELRHKCAANLADLSQGESSPDAA